MEHNSRKTQYYIAKCANFTSLKTCVKSGRWACRDRVYPPHPRDILSQAFHDGSVVIIFSVNNCHGWHGYAEMTTPPEDYETECEDPGSRRLKICPTETTNENLSNTNVLDEKRLSQCCDSDSHQCKERFEQNDEDALSRPENNTCEPRDNVSKPEDHVSKPEENVSKPEDNISKSEDNVSKSGWHYFGVNWIIDYVTEFGEQCLSSKLTEEIIIGDLPLNKCRNWQKIPADVGEMICKMMRKFHSDLCIKRDDKIKRDLENQLPPFYEETTMASSEETWRRIVRQVEGELGKVVLACPFGSQRYNLSTPESDTDMFIVYQAKTSDILGFNPPKQTIKSTEGQVCDYTIHEIYRFCELLLSGDARCVETLFLPDSTVVQGSAEWDQLKTNRHLLLNRECLNKYLRDAQGTRGTKLLKKWCDENKDAAVLPKKMCKLLYVIIRLLQNARDIVNGGDLRVYREEGGDDKNLLMSIRDGNFPTTEAWRIIKELENCINGKAETVQEKSQEVVDFVEKWLLSLRYTDFKQ